VLIGQVPGVSVLPQRGQELQGAVSLQASRLRAE
jgi:hypothetical protein